MTQTIVHGIPDVVTIFLCACAFAAGPFVIGVLTSLLEAVCDFIKDLV